MMTDYPGLEAVSQGRVSGEFAEWPTLRDEAKKVLAEIERLQATLFREREGAEVCCHAAGDSLRALKATIERLT